jgi:hypothetical protein
LGVGTGDASQMDRGIIELGILSSANYIVRDVQTVDGKDLIKLQICSSSIPTTTLHNIHKRVSESGKIQVQWTGDWCESSPLWTKRLKKKFNTDFEKEIDCFFVSFSDFCFIFRDLYVCKWSDPNIWNEQILAGNPYPNP